MRCVKTRKFSVKENVDEKKKRCTLLQFNSIRSFQKKDKKVEKRRKSRIKRTKDRKEKIKNRKKYLRISKK